MTARLFQYFEDRMLFKTIQRVTAGVVGRRSPHLLAYDFPRQVASTDLVARAVNRRARHHVAKFAHVARPRMTLQHLDSLRSKAAARVVLLKKKSGQRANIL